MSTNFPIVYLGDSSFGAIQFARSFDFDQMGPRSATEGVCSFVLPELANGSYQVHVSASGLDSSNSVPTSVSMSTMKPQRDAEG